MVQLHQIPLTKLLISALFECHAVDGRLHKEKIRSPQ